MDDKEVSTPQCVLPRQFPLFWLPPGGSPLGFSAAERPLPRAASFLQNPAPTRSVSSPPSPTRSPSALPPAFRNETALAFPSLTLHLSSGTLIPFRPPRFSLVRPAQPKSNSRPPAPRCLRSPATSAA